MDRITLKSKAKAQLESNIFGQKWMIGVLLFFILFAVESILASFSFGLAAIILTGPLTYAISLMFLKQARDGEAMAISDIVKGFTDDFAGTFLIGLMTAIFTFLWSLLFIIPGIIKSLSYSMAYFIKADNPDYDWKQCIELSKDITRGHIGELFILDLSFIGWFIVGSLCLGIGTLWVLPYQMATHAHFYEAIKPATVNQGFTQEQSFDY